MLARVSSPWTIITLRRRRRAERDNVDCRFAVAAGTYGASSRGAVAVCRGWGYLSPGDRLGHALSLTSQQIWLLCALCAGLLLALAIRWLLTPPAALVRASHVETSCLRPGAIPSRAWRLLMVYGLAGFGYIITATYLPLFGSGSLTRSICGRCSAPSCLIWHKLVLKWGYRQALTRNLLVRWRDPSSLQRFIAALSALLVGFTFMGTVTIALPKAKSLSHQVSFNMIAAMTALYGGDRLPGRLSPARCIRSASFNPALCAAALALLIAAGLVFTERQSPRFAACATRSGRGGRCAR
ncbi:YbfB/YjiJ family MFS transporter [Klebsiella pneumoniae]|nr:YbfB/YjiJ family MFS transporter [Klebsiella pneumoniae]